VKELADAFANTVKYSEITRKKTWDGEGKMADDEATVEQKKDAIKKLKEGGIS
jgi:hypothetical protein